MVARHGALGVMLGCTNRQRIFCDRSIRRLKARGTIKERSEWKPDEEALGKKWAGYDVIPAECVAAKRQ